MTMTAKERRAELKPVELGSIVSQNPQEHVLRKQAAAVINSPVGLGPGDRIDLAIFGIATGIYDNPLIYKAMEAGRYRLLRASGLDSLLYAGKNRRSARNIYHGPLKCTLQNRQLKV